MIDIDQYNAFIRAGYNRIPLVRDLLVDLDTPLSVYLKLANQPHSFLLESVHGSEQWGRYSIIGLPAQTRLSVQGDRFSVIQNDREIETSEVEDPLEAIETWRAQFNIAPILSEAELPRFTGGLVGYFGYDTVRYIEPALKLRAPPDQLNLPDILLMVAEEVAIFDTLTSKIHFVVLVDPTQPDAYYKAQNRLDQMVLRLQSNAYSALHHHLDTHSSSVSHTKTSRAQSEVAYSLSQEQFEEGVRQVKRLIQDGECQQVVLSQRMSIPYHAAPIELYRALRLTNPSPYMYFIHAGEHHIVGSSPEILVRKEDREVTLRPIAGTRPRGQTPEADATLEKELLNDPKELAEHEMLIDLGRQDLDSITSPESITLTERGVVERYSHVMHLVSNLTAQLREGISPLEVLKATFPAGTLSGSPKLRALQIIDELEPIQRGVYGGAIGYLSWSDNMDLAIAIRTAIIKSNRLYIQTGAGIVDESLPEKEWEETINKGRAIFSAVDRVNEGLDSTRNAQSDELKNWNDLTEGGS
jgi:anthranilate synthase component 1